MRENFDDRVKEWFLFKNGNIKVKLEDDEGIETFDKAKSVHIIPSLFGSYILSHSKRLMNEVINQIAGNFNNIFYYTDTDSLYIHKNTGLIWLIMDSLVYLLDSKRMNTETRVYIGF